MLGLQQPVFLHFVTQRIAAEPQTPCRLRLISVRSRQRLYDEAFVVIGERVFVRGTATAPSPSPMRCGDRR